MNVSQAMTTSIHPSKLILHFRPAGPGELASLAIRLAYNSLRPRVAYLVGLWKAVHYIHTVFSLCRMLS